MSEVGQKLVMDFLPSYSSDWRDLRIQNSGRYKWT